MVTLDDTQSRFRSVESKGGDRGVSLEGRDRWGRVSEEGIESRRLDTFDVQKIGNLILRREEKGRRLSLSNLTETIIPLIHPPMDPPH